MSGWSDWIFGNLPLQPVQGDPVNPAYSQMPDATAPITDVRGAGPSSWMSRPHDQDIASRNLGGYADLSAPMGGPDYQWRKAHGYEGNLPTTPLADPDYYPDPSITAQILAAKEKEYADQMGGWGPVTPFTNMPQIAGPLSQGMWDGQ